MRVLFWDRDGFCLLTKRLDSGTFRRVNSNGKPSLHIELSASELMLILEGIDVSAFKRRKRFTHTARQA